MQLTDEHIAEFQSLYRKHFGTDIGKDEALEKALRLIRLVEVVSRAAADELSETKTISSSPRRVP